MEKFDRVVTGHTHTGGFFKTGKEKLYMNSGDSTSYVQALACDKNGLWALLTARLDGLHICTEQGLEYSEPWDKIGLPNPYMVGEGLDMIGHRRVVEAYSGPVRELVSLSLPH